MINQSSTNEVQHARALPWGYWTAALAILALVVSIMAFVFALHADVVKLGPLSGTPLLDAYRAQVEEMQRANDRILNTAWAVIGATVALATVLVTFNFIRSDRVVEQERSLIYWRFQDTLGRVREEVSSTSSQATTAVATLRAEYDERVGRLEQSQTDLDEALKREARKRAELQFHLIQMQSEMMNLARDITSASGPLLPFRYMRMYGPFTTGIAALDAALDAQNPAFINQALNQILYAVQGPIPGDALRWLDELYQKVSDLPGSFDPLRHEVLQAVLERIKKRDEELGRES